VQKAPHSRGFLVQCGHHGRTSPGGRTATPVRVGRGGLNPPVRIPAPIESSPPREAGDAAPGDRRFLAGPAFSALSAIAEVSVDTTLVPPREVAANVDRYMGRFRAQRKWVVNVGLIGLWLYPLRFLRAPLPKLKPEARREFVETRFVAGVAYPRIRFLRRLVQAMFRLSMQMAYLGYYGDERTFERVGYQPFSKRPRYAEAVRELAVDRPRVTSISPGAVNGDTLSADAVVVGSGAAGAIVAYRLAEAGKRVLVLERGRHLDPSEFTEDEVEQISNLYADGALQLSRDFSFQVLQGMCVGGSTVVNNAVCFDIPTEVLSHWNGKLDAGLDEGRLADSFAEVRSWLQVMRPPSPYLQAGAQKFLEGVQNLGLDNGSNGLDVVEANISNCPGSGYCNIGCPFGTKLSMLDKVLPDGQLNFGVDRLRVLPECRAERIERDGSRATGVVASLAGGRRLRVKADTVVVSAGAIASSWLLMQSKIAKGRAGRGLHFNIASPITADFEDELHSYDGVQISHYFEPPHERGFVMETWFNPVVSQALNMPGWLRDHEQNMGRFRNLTAAGVLVGTTKPGRLSSALTGGADIVYTPHKDDVRTLIEALKLLGRIYLAAGALRVMPSTFQFHELRSAEELDQLDEYVEKTGYLSIGTGHPQGGNAISRDAARGVVDERFRVHGFDNLFVCDASVFPTATTVNPQLTVMALAQYAAPGIAEVTA
jgi:choline dehydrogenase-like flavoprotein